MCGRYASARSVDDLASTYGISGDDIDDLPGADWNVAPTKQVPAVAVRDGRRALTSLRWGLVPSWSASPGGATLFNARIETVAEKPAFREVIRRRRCLLPADGWYEWARLPDGRRVPHFLTSRDRDVVSFAGIWDAWRDGEGRWLRSVAILTGEAVGHLASIHDRAPVVLPAESWTDWLDEQTSLGDIEAMLLPTDPALIEAWPVSDLVGDVRAAGAQLTERVALNEQPTLF